MKRKLDKIYNVKILKNYVSFLKEEVNVSDHEIEEIFIRSGSDISILDGDDNWFDQKLADSFYKEILEFTGIENVSYRVGKFSALSSNKGVAGHFIASLVTPNMVLKNINHIASQYSLGSKFKIIKNSRSAATLRSFVKENYSEKPYQCENRQGMLEAIPKLCGGNLGRIKHDVCIHRGDEYCEYHLSWDYSDKIKIQLKIVVPIVLIICLFYIFSNQHTLLVSSFLLMLGVIFHQRSLRHGDKDIITEQKKALDIAVNSLGRNQHKDLLAKEVFSASTRNCTAEELFITFSKSIKSKMPYDRVLMFQVCEESKQLVLRSSEGLELLHKDFIKGTSFNLDKDDSRGFLVTAVKEKKSRLIRNVSKQIQELSSRSQKFVKILKTKSLVVMPIIFEDKCLGAIAIDNYISEESLTVDDLELLESIADVLGIALANSENYSALSKAFDNERENARREKAIKENFLKYVPNNLSDSSDFLLDVNFSLKNEKIAIMFIDIVGFSTLCENTELSKVSLLLNYFIENINEIVCKHNGVINKIMGDGLLIYFTQSVSDCVACGEEILNSMPSFKKLLKKYELPQVSIGIGAHYGFCNIGNIGYDDRVDYTLIGDSVNIAARIESKTREFGDNSFCVSESIKEQVENFIFDEKGSMSLKGRQGKVKIFKFICSKSKRNSVATVV